MRFIELHSNDGDRIIVNVDKIITIEPTFDGSSLTLIDSQLDVREKPDDIILKIRG
jgi:uncharacterized protein YlzI (FlbEa/FlbD family)